MERVWAIFESLMWRDGEATLYGLVGIAVLTLAEQVWPAEPDQSVRGRLRNLVFLVQFKVLGIGALAFWYAYAPAIPVVRVSLDPAWASLAVVANLIAADLCYYAYHRAQHRFGWLWAIHELHHADAELNATSSYRTYWLEAPAQTILVVTPTVLLFGGLGPDHARMVVTISLFFLIFSHANLRLELGPLTDWVLGPQVHRVHHSREGVHRDRNFAQAFPFLDRLFGTYYRPGPGEFPPTGAEHLASDASLLTAMLQPFRIWAGWQPPVARGQSEGAGDAQS